MTDKTDQGSPLGLWLAALRSGEYKQGKGHLCRDDSYCCLGVLCEVYQKNGPGDLVVTHDDFYQNIKRYDGNAEGPPAKVLSWLGYNNFTKGHSNLMYLNDDLGYSFDRIAEEIEKIGLLEYIS